MLRNDAPPVIFVQNRDKQVAYTLRDDLIALPMEQAKGQSMLSPIQLDDQLVVILPKRLVAGEQGLPVYQRDELLAVATGYIFVQFADGFSPSMAFEEIDKAGYEIARELAYAPSAVWLRHRSGVAEGLNGVQALMTSLRGRVEVISPQIVFSRHKREKNDE